MNHSQGTFRGAGGLPLFYQAWYPRGAVRGAIALVHGLGAHSGLFERPAHYLTHYGYGVYALDLRGHGRSPGQRGYIATWAEFREDLAALSAHVVAQQPCCPLFVWGHSLGGTIVLDWVMRSPLPDRLTGVIASAPALGAVGVPPVRLALGRGLSRVWPRFSLSLGLRDEMGSRDPLVTLGYAADPLRHCYGTARLATEFLATADWLYRHPEALKTPVLMLHGAADQVTSPSCSRAFFERVTGIRKHYIEYPQAYHDLHTDVNYKCVFRDVRDWLQGQTPEAIGCRIVSWEPGVNHKHNELAI